MKNYIIKKNNGVLTLIVGLLIIALNYMNVRYVGNYGRGVFYIIVYSIGIVAIILGAYLLIKKKI